MIAINIKKASGWSSGLGDQFDVEIMLIGYDMIDCKVFQNKLDSLAKIVNKTDMTFEK